MLGNAIEAVEEGLEISMLRNAAEIPNSDLKARTSIRVMSAPDV